MIVGLEIGTALVEQYCLICEKATERQSDDGANMILGVARGIFQLLLKARGIFQLLLKGYDCA